MAQSAADELARRVLGANPRQPTEILGLQHDATLEEARRAYRLLARDLHPDKNASPLAIEAFRLCGQAKEHLEQALNGSSRPTAQSHSQSNAWAAFTCANAPHVAAAPAQPRQTHGTVGSDAAAWACRPQPAAARAAWGAGSAAPDCTAHTGAPRAPAAEEQPQQHLHAQQAACSRSSGSKGPDQESDGGSTPLPTPARAAEGGVQTSWNPQPRAQQQRRASQLFPAQGGSLPTTFASGRSQHSSLPASAPQPDAGRPGDWPDAVPPLPPPDARSHDRHIRSSWSPSRRRSQLPLDFARVPESPPQPQPGWLPPARARPPLAAACGMFADDAGHGPSSPGMCSLPDGSQHSFQHGPGSAGGGHSIVLGTSDSEGAAAAPGLGSAPADVLDDDEDPLAEFHWASQARSSLSQPLPGGRRRSSVTTGSRGGAPGSRGVLHEHRRDGLRSPPEPEPLQAADGVSEWHHSGDSSPLQQPIRSGQDEVHPLHAQPHSQGGGRARNVEAAQTWAGPPRQRGVPASLPSGADFLVGGVRQGGSGAGSGRCGVASAAGAAALEDAWRSSGSSPAAPQRRRKRVLAVVSDTDDEVQEDTPPPASKAGKVGGKPSASAAAVLRQRVLSSSSDMRSLPRAFEAVEVAMVQRQTALKEQTAALARQKASSAKQRVLARMYGRRQGGKRAVRTRG